MWNLSDVRSIEYPGGRVFHITFQDGLAGEVDFSDTSRGDRSSSL